MAKLFTRKNILMAVEVVAGFVGAAAAIIQRNDQVNEAVDRKVEAKFNELRNEGSNEG